MTPAAVVLAIIPPVFALLVESFNPVSERLIRSSAKRDLEQYEVGINHEHLIDDATRLTNGAVEVSGLAPTLVATVTSGFAALYEYPNPWLIMAYVLIFVGLVLITLRFLAGQTFVQIDSQRPLQTVLGYEITLPWPGSKAVTRLIFVANGLLIAFVLFTYCALEKPWHYFLSLVP